MFPEYASGCRPPSNTTISDHSPTLERPTDGQAFSSESTGTITPSASTEAKAFEATDVTSSIEIDEVSVSSVDVEKPTHPQVVEAPDDTCAQLVESESIPTQDTDGTATTNATIDDLGSTDSDSIDLLKHNSSKLDAQPTENPADIAPSLDASRFLRVQTYDNTTVISFSCPVESQASSENSVVANELIEVQDLDGISTLLRDLTELVRKNVKIDPLESAISLLQSALKEGTRDEKSRSILLIHLINALLLRYGLHRWIEDLDTCEQRLYDMGPKNARELIGQDEMIESLQSVEVQVASGLVQSCKNSFEIGTLNSIVCIATGAIQSDINISSSRAADLLIILANALIMKYLFQASLDDLDQAALRYRQAAGLCSNDSTLAYTCLVSLTHVLWLRFMTSGGAPEAHLLWNYIQRGDTVDGGRQLMSVGNETIENASDHTQMQEGIELLTASLRHRVGAHPRRPWSLWSLAKAYSARFRMSNAVEDIHKSIELYREVLDLCPRPHPNRPQLLNSLAIALSTLFQERGACEDLDKAVVLYQEALVLCATSRSERSVPLNNLASALLTRFKQRGSPKDLDESIVLYREAVTLDDASDPDCSMQTNNLASALHTRFEHKGAFQDLEESISLYRKAVHLCPTDKPTFFSSQSNLATALCVRFKWKGALEDLNESIVLHRKSLDLCPTLHPERSGLLNNFANALLNHFGQIRSLKDLDESIAIHKEALDLRPGSHSYQSQSLNNLGNALATRFKHSGASPDLDQTIVLYGEALDLHTKPHPAQTASLSNLAFALTLRFEQRGEPQDIKYALNLYEEAVESATGSLMDRIKCSRRWITCAQNHQPALTFHAYECSMALLPQIVSLDLSLTQRQDVLAHVRYLVGEAAKCAIDEMKLDVAVTFVSTGRSLFWSQALQLRTPVNELAVSHPELADRYTIISKRLENASHSADYSIPNPSKGITTDTSTHTFASLYTLANQHNKVIEEIRRIPQFERFLLPPSFSILQSAAEGGPIVILNGSTNGHDALVMSRTGPLLHVPLSDICCHELEAVKTMIGVLLTKGTRSIDICQDTIANLRQVLDRDMSRQDTSAESNDNLFSLVLGYLWVQALRPVIRALAVEKTDSPRRVWWCPTGSFASLPIHAAGIYTEDGIPVDCLFEYVVSSYCSSPQVLHPTPETTKAFKMLAIFEPEAPGAAALPATLEELQKISEHIPYPGNLIAHVGSRAAPIQIENLMSDITQSSFVHFGCHGLQNLGNPLESYLLLSGGKLTMENIIKECRVPEGALAYLSACETAKGDEARPDESLNLVATMMFAGFRSVVGTLWSILDDDAPIVVDVFYRHLFRNGSNAPPNVKDAAYGLHLATQELRSRGKPFHSWVPYVHYGI